MKVDLALVGGGLANSLIAYRLLARHPDYPLVVIESQQTLGGTHTWSFHDTDLDADQLQWIQPLVAHSWDRHELRFPNRHRIMEQGYNSVTSESLHRAVAAALDEKCVLGRAVVRISPDVVVLEDGSEIQARTVIDGRGDPGGRYFDVGFQKFVGLTLRLETDHGLEGPVLMDATVEQRDGYRFFYVLPFTDKDLLIEDTYYSNEPTLDREKLRVGILAYASDRGWAVARSVGEESGVLPIVLDGDIKSFWADGLAGVPRSGMRAALFHPTTGYSLPEAVRLADEVARNLHMDSEALFELVRSRSLELWRRTRFFRLLNRMLFRAAEPDQRYRIFERFYGLDENLISRFYAGRLEWKDKLRVLTGRPPVPVLRALACLREKGHQTAPLQPEERNE